MFNVWRVMQQNKNRLEKQDLSSKGNESTATYFLKNKHTKTSDIFVFSLVIFSGVIVLHRVNSRILLRIRRAISFLSILCGNTFSRIRFGSAENCFKKGDLNLFRRNSI